MVANLSKVRVALGTSNIVAGVRRKENLMGLFSKTLWFHKLLVASKNSGKGQIKLKSIKGLLTTPENSCSRMILYYWLEWG